MNAQVAELVRFTRQVEELERLAAEGFTAAEAGQRVGIRWKQATQVALSYGFRFLKEGEATEARLRKAAAEGLTQAEAARRLGLEPSTVARRARRHGIVFRTHAEAVALAREAALTREEAERLARWREATAARRDTKAAQAQPRPLTPLEAMHRLAARENAAMRRPA